MEKTYTGSCHCGAVKFEVAADIDHVRVCDCSVCKKRGALNVRVSSDKLRLLTRLEDMTLYEWGTKTAKDYFCPKCGILPFRRPRHRTAEEVAAGAAGFDGWAVNVRCLDGFDLTNVPIKNVFGSKLPLPEPH